MSTLTKTELLAEANKLDKARLETGIGTANLIRDCLKNGDITQANGILSAFRTYAGTLSTLRYEKRLAAEKQLQWRF